MDFARFLRNQQKWSTETFGPYTEARTQGILDHARKEIEEIAAEPNDVEEWIDLMILAIDGALAAATLRYPAGHYQAEKAVDLVEWTRDQKMEKNIRRNWPAQADQVPGLAVEHISDDEEEAEYERRNGLIPTSTPTPTKCANCDGCGQIANDSEGTPWTYWANLPVKSAAAVLIGLVRPVTCPNCDGSGTV